MKYRYALSSLFLSSALSVSAALAEPRKSVEADLENAARAYAEGRYAQAAVLAEGALAAISAKAPLVIENFYAVAAEADYFGGFGPRAHNIHDSGETLYFYMEPKNVVFASNGEKCIGVFPSI